MEKQRTFVETLKGKIIIVFTLIFVSLAVMWAINRIAFERITTFINELTTPDQKLALTRQLFINVADLPHQQQAEILKGKNKLSRDYLDKVTDVHEKVDVLREFLIKQPSQLSRIDTINSLLISDQRLFSQYLNHRYQLQQKKVFERQLNSLAARMDTTAVRVDSSVTTSERKTKVTTIVPADSVPRAAKKGSWIKRLFKKREEEVAAASKVPEVIIEEEIKSHVDTLSVARSDTSMRGLKSTLNTIEKRRTRTIRQLTSTEEDLLKANNELIHQLLTILREVEKQEMDQVAKKTSLTTLLTARTLSQTKGITILLVCVALVLGILILTDVTRSRDYREQLEEAKAEAEFHSMSKQRFLSNMSHEIRTPLQSILGYAEQQLHKKVYDKQNLEAIYSSSQHLLQIVNEVLDYSRIISGKFSFENIDFSVPKVLGEVLPAMQVLASQKSIDLFVEKQCEPIEYVNGDPFRLKQVVYNLVGNAIKFTDAGWIKLSVATEKQKDRAILKLVVEDTGIGMSKGELGSIFNQFEQVGPAGKNSSGTGLGLSIVKELVEGQHGTISVQSEPGKGSQFAVTIPYQIAANVGPVVDSGPAALFSFKGKIWMVDDDALIRRLTSAILNKSGIEHLCFPDGESLLNHPWDKDVRIVFADIRLPGISGATLCTVLKKKIPSYTKIIALTAQILPEEKQAILSTGFDGLLLKPFNEAGLMNVIAQTVEPQILPPAIDLSVVQRMVGDPDQLNMVLQQCIDETAEDMQVLQSAVEKEDFDKTLLIVHRLAGRLGQFGCSTVALRLRKLEAALKKTNNVEDLITGLNTVTTEIDFCLSELSGAIQSVDQVTV